MGSRERHSASLEERTGLFCETGWLLTPSDSGQFSFLNCVLLSRVDLCVAFGGWLFRPFALWPGETIFAEVNISERELWVVHALFVLEYFVYIPLSAKTKQTRKNKKVTQNYVYIIRVEWWSDQSVLFAFLKS